MTIHPCCSISLGGQVLVEPRLERAIIDGEAIVSDDIGLAVFDPLRSWRTNLSAVLCAFDLIDLDGNDLRRRPIEQRKRTLAELVGAPQPGITVNEHFIGDGISSTSRLARLVVRAL